MSLLGPLKSGVGFCPKSSNFIFRWRAHGIFRKNRRKKVTFFAIYPTISRKTRFLTQNLMARDPPFHLVSYLHFRCFLAKKSNLPYVFLIFRLFSGPIFNLSDFSKFFSIFLDFLHIFGPKLRKKHTIKYPQNDEKTSIFKVPI